MDMSSYNCGKVRYYMHHRRCMLHMYIVCLAFTIEIDLRIVGIGWLMQQFFFGLFGIYDFLHFSQICFQVFLEEVMVSGWLLSAVKSLK